MSAETNTPPPTLTHSELAQALGTSLSTLAQAWSTRHLQSATVAAQAAEQMGEQDIAAGYRDSFARPLLQVLRGVLEHGDSRWLAVYLDERRRYLSAAADGPELAAAVETDISELLELDLADREGTRTVLATIHRSLTDRAPAAKLVRLGLVGDCLMTEMRAYLRQAAAEQSIALDVSHEYFSADHGGVPGMAQTIAKAERGELDLVGISYLTFDALPLYKALRAESGLRHRAAAKQSVAAIVTTVQHGLEALRAVSDVPVLLHTAGGLPLDRIRRRVPFFAPQARATRKVLSAVNDQLRELAAATDNVLVVDEAELLRPGGLRAGSAPLFPAEITDGAVFHTSVFGALLADEYAGVAGDLTKLGKCKVLCVDFDNTLWSGVMAEGPVVHDLDAQRLLARLREAGILLVSVSKNDPGSIRWEEMALTSDDFVLHKVSWNQKAQSILEAAQQLDLGIDSFVLIDDNPVERALVAEAIPQMTVLDPLEAHTWQAVSRLLSFPNTRQTQEAKLRTEKYRETAARREALIGDLDYPAMMAGLDLKVTWGPLREDQVTRAHELMSRTNQFNTTTRRRSAHQIRELMASAVHDIYAFDLADRFGDLGLVGLVVLRDEDTGVVVDSVIMSCRSMGFGLEQFMVLAPLAARGAESATGEFIASERNGPSAGLFASCGFGASADGIWALPNADAAPELPPWLHVTAT